MKVYLATSGEYSDYRVCHAFAREEDAASYALGDAVLELEVRDGPVEVRPEHTLPGGSQRPAGPGRRVLARTRPTRTSRPGRRISTGMSGRSLTPGTVRRSAPGRC